MITANYAIYGREYTTPNTIIAGVASVITSPALLASKLGIAEGRIILFKIVGSNLEVRITGTYSFPSSCFNADSHILEYWDLEGLLVSFSSTCFSGSTIKKFSSPSIDFIASNVPNYVFRNCTALELCYIPNAKNLTYLTNGGAFSGCSNVNLTADLSGVTAITGYQTFQNSGFKNLILNNLVSMVYAGALSNQFSGMTNVELIEMKKLKVFNPVNANNSNFTNLKTGCIIRVNSALLTDNSGAPNGQLVWVKANRAAVVQFYDDSGNYVSTL